MRDAMPVDNYLGSADELVRQLFGAPSEEQQKALEEQHLADLAVAQAAARVFSTDDGRLVLEHLLDVTLRRPTFIAHANLDPMRAYAHGVMREGQNQIVFVLLQAIARGRQQDLPQREGLNG